MSPSYNIIENEYNKSDYNIDGAYGTIGPHDDEAYYDNRSDATDDIEKGRLKFPKRIYGRERELETLLNIYDELATGAESSKKQERRLSSIFEDEEDGEEPPAADLYSSHVVFLSGYSGIGKSGKWQNWLHNLALFLKALCSSYFAYDMLFTCLILKLD